MVSVNRMPSIRFSAAFELEERSRSADKASERIDDDDVLCSCACLFECVCLLKDYESCNIYKKNM